MWQRHASLLQYDMCTSPGSWRPLPKWSFLAIQTAECELEELVASIGADFRACLVVPASGSMDYTARHEHHLSKQPFQRRMGLSPTALADQVTMQPTPTPLPPLCLRRPVLSVAYRLPLGVWALPTYLPTYLPCNFAPWQTVYSHFRPFCRTGLWPCLSRALPDAARRCVGKNPEPSAAIMDAQSVKTVEESGGIRGFDAHKWVKGRKRHLLVDTLGLPSPCTSPQPTCLTRKAPAVCWWD